LEAKYHTNPQTVPEGRILNNSGVVSSYADTTAPDPNAPDFCFDADCLVAHAFPWQNGVMHDLGPLAYGYSSLVASINDRGWGAGFAQTGVIDPINGGPQGFATLWKDGRLLNLGALPGGNESLGVTINNAGQVSGPLAMPASERRLTQGLRSSALSM
jgi:uncharacterized membrane protein